MMKRKNGAFAIVVIGLLAGPVFAAERAPSGADLYKYHGCINCHGAEAKNPVSNVVPNLAGKPADELYSKAKKILSGEDVSEQSEVMHAAFYSPAQCDNPPTDAELQAISTWMSER